MGKRYCFTLIELFLTIGLITLIGGAFLFQAKPLLDRYHFKHGITKLEQELLFTRRLSEIANAYITFIIQEVDGGLQCIRETDEPLRIPHAINISFDIPHAQLKRKKKIYIYFLGNGGIDGDLSFSISRGKEKKNFHLDARVEKKRSTRYDGKKNNGDIHEIQSASI